MSSENVRFSRMLTHPSLLQTTKGDAEDIETSIVSQLVAEQQLEMMESEITEQNITPPPSPPAPSRKKVKRKEMNWEPQKLNDEGASKGIKMTAQEEIEMEKQKEENRTRLEEETPKPEVVPTSPTEQEVFATPQTLSNHVEEEQNADKRMEQQKVQDTTKEKPSVPPTVIFKHLKQQYQSISEKLKEQEEKELVRRATLESRKRDAAKLREVRQSQKLTALQQKQKQQQSCTEQPVKETKEIVIQLDQMGSYTAFENLHKEKHSTSKVSSQKRHHTVVATSGGTNSPGDDEYYQQMNTIHDASEAT